jgi:hypothetical protein
MAGTPFRDIPAAVSELEPLVGAFELSLRHMRMDRREYKRMERDMISDPFGFGLSVIDAVMSGKGDSACLIDDLALIDLALDILDSGLDASRAAEADSCVRRVVAGIRPRNARKGGGTAWRVCGSGAGRELRDTAQLR